MYVQDNKERAHTAHLAFVEAAWRVLSSHRTFKPVRVHHYGYYRIIESYTLGAWVWIAHVVTETSSLNPNELRGG